MIVGNEYYIKAKLPFKLVTKGKYTLNSSKLISEYKSQSIDVYQLLYKPNGLTEEDMMKDMELKVPILSFSTSTGNIVELPKNKVEQVSMNSVDYATYGIGLKFDMLPVGVDVDNLLVQLKNVAIENIGVAPVLSVVRLSEIEMVLQEDHDENELKRKLRKKVMSKDSRIKQLELLLNEEKNKNETLMNCLRTR